MNDRIDRVADLAHTFEPLAVDAAAGVEPSGADSVASSGPIGRPQPTLVAERDHDERVGDRPEPATRFTVEVPTPDVFADVIDVLVAADISAAR